MKKIVVLTGCSRGIGFAILQSLLNSDNNLIIIGVGKRKPDLEEIGNFFFYEGDLSDLSQAQAICNQIIDTYGRVDWLINNAGAGVFKELELISMAEWIRIMNLNLSTPFIFIKSFLPSMKQFNYGRIISISSDADYKGFKEGGLYCASKFGLRGMVESVREELVGLNISISNISPGRVDTYFNNKKPGDRPISLFASDVASQVMHILSQSERCQIESIYLRSNLE
ncbi:MAG: SDR family oxidoreductase [Bacteroidota bacterium]